MLSFFINKILRSSWCRISSNHDRSGNDILISALVFIVEKMGTILQLTMTLESMTMGPQLGVFSMGILMPWVDATVRNVPVSLLKRLLLRVRSEMW